MAAAQVGDQRSYDNLLREILPFIRAIARRHHGDTDRVEEVAQDVLLTVHRVRHTYDPARPFSPWLAAITRCRSIDALRRRRRRATFEVAQDSAGSAYESFVDPAADRLAEVHATADYLGKAIIGLPPQQREAIELLRLRGLSLIEAATLTGRSVAALKVNVHRALKSLQQQLHT